MSALHAASAPTDRARRSNFTRVLYIVVVVLATIALGTRVIQGLRTGSVDWLAMTAPAAVLLALTGIIVGPRRRAIYYPVLLVSLGLLIASYAIPRRRRPATPPRTPAATPAATPAPSIPPRR